MIFECYKDYKALSLLGQGGMATVYLAEHKTLGHKVAIKVLNKEYFHNDNIRKRFLAEARSLAGMNHPNIVRVMDWLEENESSAFVMEYIEGRTLRDYLEEKGKLKDDQIQHLFGQMLDAVRYVHEQGLIHRDIKPSNFMLDGRGNIKLLDFGIAKATDANSAEYTQTGTGVQMCTPMYMSPEQVQATNPITPQSDIYSLGVMLWQMVSGEKPYDLSAISNFQLQLLIVNEPLKVVNSKWDSLIQKATQKNLSDRFANCDEFGRNIKILVNTFELMDTMDLNPLIINDYSEETIIGVDNKNSASEPFNLYEKDKTESPYSLNDLISEAQKFVMAYQYQENSEVIAKIYFQYFMSYSISIDAINNFPDLPSQLNSAKNPCIEYIFKNYEKEEINTFLKNENCF
jgi:serine/threonine-protein kinase